MSLQMGLLKRKRGPLGVARMELSADEQTVFNAIHSKGSEGITKQMLKKEIQTLNTMVFGKCIKSLTEKRKIKEEKSASTKNVHLMAVEFKASTSGGKWYVNGELDKEFIDKLKDGCVTLLRKTKAKTADGLCGLVNKSKGFNEEIEPGDINEILESLVLDGLIMKVKSTGSGIYDSIPIGADCYTLSKNGQPDAATATPAMALMPCGSCPRINQCPSNGAISPITCPMITESSNQRFLTEDIIVAEILPRLHVKALFRSKCVSTHYETIISDPKFGKKYVQRAYSSQESCSSSGLLVSLLFPCMSDLYFENAFTDKVKNLSNTMNSSTHMQYHDDKDQVSICTLFNRCNHRYHQILGSSGGLVLYAAHEQRNMGGYFSLCVSNPLTKQCVELPEKTKELNYFMYGFATRWDNATASLTYKVMIFRPSPSRHTFTRTIEVFSSDTGNWVSWEALGPADAFFRDNTWNKSFSYKGVLYWMDCKEMSVITYNPYDSPDKFHRFRLPRLRRDKSKKINSHRSLIYSGEEELLKFCDCLSESGVDRILVRVWKLEDPDKEKWCLEGDYYVPSIGYDCRRLMVAPYPWNRRLLCHPYLKSTSIKVLNLSAATWESVDVFTDVEEAVFFDYESVSYDLIFYPAEWSPWSSPLHHASAI